MQRNQGVNVLRIVLAFMVIALHFNSGLGEVEKNAADLSHNWIVIWMVESICYGAVNCYILISGYFDENAELSYVKIRRRLLKLWGALIFYSVAEYLTISLIYQNPVTIVNLIIRCFPLSNKEWWFMTNYFIVVILSPIIQNGIKNLAQKTLISLWLVFLLAFCIIPQFQLWNDNFSIENGYGIIWFVYVYFTGTVLSVLEKNKNTLTINKIYLFFKSYSLLIYIGLVLLLLLSKLFIAVLSNRLFGEVKYSGLLFSYNSILVFFASIALFLFFKNIRFKSDHRLLNMISTMALASYLFHCQTDFKKFVWGSLDFSRFSNSNWLPIVFISCLIGMFSVSILIECLRILGIRCIKTLTTALKSKRFISR